MLRGLGFSVRTESKDRSPVPVALWADTLDIGCGRQKTLAPMSSWCKNRPVYGLATLRLKAVTPAEPLHDPYILALLISVAQGQLEAVEHDQGPPKDPLMEFRLRFQAIYDCLTANKLP
jgi:hypothetical protein